MSSILIVGYGTVGSNLHKELSALNPDIYDKKGETPLKPGLSDLVYRKYTPIWNTKDNDKVYDIAFICVDTPLSEDGINLDITEVRNAIDENKARVYVIKSTCPIGTVNFIKQLTRKHIIFSPEYYGSTQHANNWDFNFTILGGDEADCIYVQQALQKCYDGRHTFHITDSRTAELVKFMENSWIATKVSFCDQFYEIANYNGVSYEELRELFILDPRVNPSHTFVDRNNPYWDSHCLNKDVNHIANTETAASLLRSVVEYNNSKKKESKNEC